VNRGNTYLKLGDPVSALHDYERALQLEPDRIDVMYNEAVAYEQLGDADSAALAVLEIARLMPEAAWVVNLQGATYYRQSDWEKAAVAFERAHQLAPKEEIPLFNLAQTRYQMADYEASQVAYEALVQLAPDNATYYLRLADAYQIDHRVGVAERALDKAIELRPDYIEAYLMRGALNLRGGRFAAASADAQAVIDLNSEDGRGYALLGEVQLARQQWWDATDTFTLALDAGDTRAEVYKGRGWAWHQLRYMPYAVRDYEKAVALGDGDPMLLYHFGLALLDVGRYGDALDPLVGAMNAGIDTPEAYAVLAVALDANKRRTEAEDAYRRAIELDARYGDLEFLREQPLWSQASINRARTILARLDAS
jgi:tetratricopeptide (TPR) repeat protein